MAAVSGAGAAAVLFAAPQPARLHQSGAAAFADGCANLAQLFHDAGRAVVLATTGMGRGDLLAQLRVLALSLGRPGLLPAVVTAARDRQDLAQQRHRVIALHRSDLGIPLPGVSERMPNDFFRTISRSWSRTTSPRRRAISRVASSRVCGAPAGTPGRGAYLRRQS